MQVVNQTRSQKRILGSMEKKERYIQITHILIDFDSSDQTLTIKINTWFLKTQSKYKPREYLMAVLLFLTHTVFLLIFRVSKPKDMPKSPSIQQTQGLLVSGKKHISISLAALPLTTNMT